MTEEYDKERTAALIKEARDIIGHLEDEAEKIKTQMERVLEGSEDEFLDAQKRERVADDASILEGLVTRKSFWRPWR